MSTSKKYTILFAPIDAVGPVNACIGIAEPLKARGHRIVFAVAKSWTGRLSPLGFEEEYFNETDAGSSGSIVEFVEKWSSTFRKPPIEHYGEFLKDAYQHFIDDAKTANPVYEKIVAKVKPDLIVIENLVPTLALTNAGIPWVLIFSCQALPVFKQIPPPYAGLSIYGDTSEWPKYQQAMTTAIKDVWHDYNRWLTDRGGDPMNRFGILAFESPLANIYFIPKELDYTDALSLPPNWYHFDNLTRTESHLTFEVPKELENKPGKLIFLSMGTLTSSDTEMFNRLIEILSKSPHRFIVSKGPLPEKIHLAENMWGQQSLPQTKVLPLVDLVITHGGNNTVVETFCNGKPMIVLPVFFDQHDSAQRLAEKGFGMRFNPYKVTEDELLPAVEKLLGDESLKAKLKAISERIKSEKCQEKVADFVEDILSKV